MDEHTDAPGARTVLIARKRRIQRSISPHAARQRLSDPFAQRYARSVHHQEAHMDSLAARSCRGGCVFFFFASKQKAPVEKNFDNTIEIGSAESWCYGAREL